MAQSINLLLVDADLQVRQALGEVLTTENYKVSLAASGDEALRQLDDQHGPAVGVVLLDLMHAPELGWAMFRRLTCLKPSLPVVVLTSRRDQTAAAAAHRCVALMQKPLDLPLLCQTLRSLTAGRELSVQPLTISKPFEKHSGSALGQTERSCHGSSSL